MLATPSPSLSPPGLVVRQCKGTEAVDLFYNWAARVGWNPGQKAGIRDVLLKTDPGAYFYGQIDPSCVIPDEEPETSASGNSNKSSATEKQSQEQTQEPKQELEESKVKVVALSEDPTVISVISAIRYGDEQAWIGCYITDPKYRGRGYGIVTFNRALQHVLYNSPHRKSVGLNAVFSQVDNYRKTGFTKSSWVNERRRGCVRELVEVKERELAERIGAEEEEGLVMLSDPRVDWEQLPAMEEKYTGFKRAECVKDWVRFHANHPEHHRVGVAFLSPDKFDPLTGKPLVLGYACVRPGLTSYRAGPLYATTSSIAKRLLVKLAVHVLDAHNRNPSMDVPLIIDIDIPDQNRDSVEMFDGIGWKNTMSTLRMWRGDVPPYDVSGCFGISTLENG
ncbi:hypothetical protein BGZ95_000733 [Linnemannia exigua]|uniref:N-acetyltransferase domain-containing protein n=1 Tax=Linnemannia exigua TaxID=604196 RepID=A0AAD4H481_9FUNG|nr:hypothetical protein BGZ95_000733 [Linnemannia exigua]